MHNILPEFLDIDEVKVTHGAREEVRHMRTRRGFRGDGWQHPLHLGFAVGEAGLNVEYVPQREPDWP